jgi:hypothetical protein
MDRGSLSGEYPRLRSQPSRGPRRRGRLTHGQFSWRALVADRNRSLRRRCVRRHCPRHSPCQRYHRRRHRGCQKAIRMYRETIEHPHSIPDPIKNHLDLTSGNDRGRLYNLVNSCSARRPKPDLGHAPSAKLVPPLADRDSWWCETAQRLLFERKYSSAIRCPVDPSTVEKPTAPAAPK